MQRSPSNAQIFKAGLWYENPVLRQVLGICSTLAVTNLLINTMVMNAGLIFTVSMSSLTVSLLRQHMPTRIRMMVQTLIIESFDNSKRIIAVGREGSGLRADYILKTELREFQAQLFNGKSPEVHIRVNLKLVRMPQREIVSATRFSVTVKSGGPKLDKIIATFDTALGRILKRTVTWTIMEIHRRSAKGGGRRRG